MRACALWLNKESYLYIQWRHRSCRNGSDSAVGAPTGKMWSKGKKKAPLPRLLQLVETKNNVRCLADCVLWAFIESVEVFWTFFDPSGSKLRGVTVKYRHSTGMKLDQVNHDLFTFLALRILIFCFLFSFFPSCFFNFSCTNVYFFRVVEHSIIFFGLF